MSGLMIIANKLNGSAALKAIVPVSKQFMVVAAQGAANPFIVMSHVSGVDEVLLGGQGEYPRERVQIDVIASTYSSALSISKIIHETLINTIKEEIPALSVKDVDITYSGMSLTDYSDDRESVMILSDYHVRWREQ